MDFVTKIWKVLDSFFLAFWGFTVIDLIAIIMNKSGLNFLTEVDNTIKVFIGLIGLLYGLIRTHHYYYDNKLNRQIKEQDLKMKIKQNEQHSNE